MYYGLLLLRTNMDEVSLVVNHQVAIVSVLDLEQVGKDAVSCQRLCEVLAGRLELLSGFLPVLFDEILVEGVF